MSLSDDQNLECPLCMEPFEMDDFTFFPCTCGYQICRFCWHRIRTDENGLCPACRKQYPEDPADFKPLSVEEFQKIKSEKRQKDQQRKHKVSESRKHLSDVRVVQKNLVFVVGLPARLADSDLLKKHDYFGKFGRIHKVVVNQSTSYAGSQGPSASAYVTYVRPEDALRAIKTVNNIQIDGRTLKASLGTTKYCSHFLKNQQCPKMDCMYLHELGDEAASFTKDDMKQGKHQEYERTLQEQHQVAINKKEAVSPTPQKKPNSSKETWPSASQNSKAARAKESKTEKQNRSKTKHASSDSQKSKKSKGKSEDLSHSNSSVKNCKNKEESLGQKRGPKGQTFSRDSIIASPSPLQRTDGSSAFRSNMNVDKQLAVNEMNNKNTQKTLVHIGEQPVCNQSMKSSTKARCDSPSFPSSPTSSSSSSLFTPYGSLSSNFLSSSPSPPPHNAGHVSYSTEDCSQNDEDGNYSPQNFLEAAPGRPQCVTFSSSKSNTLSSQLNGLSISSDCSRYGGPTTESVTRTSEPETNPLFSHSFTPQTQQHDDDLDFDPWDESSKGLADLIAKETVHTFPTTSIPPGFSHIVQSSVPNQRITPPPGFMCKKQTGNLDYPASTFMPTKEKIQPMRNETTHMFQDLPQNHGLFSKHVPMHNPQDGNSRVTEVHKTKHLQEGFRALFPNINVTFSGCGPQKSYSPSGPALNNACGEGPWLPQETSAILPGGASDGPFWRKALQQVEEDSNRFLNSPYSPLFALRGQWPSSSQCPPPGFVAPSRPPANTPYQHAQINRSELVQVLQNSYVLKYEI